MKHDITDNKTLPWVAKWAKEHTRELTRHRTEFAAVHPKQGILFHAPDIVALCELTSLLRKKVRADVAFVNVAKLLKEIGWKHPLEAMVDEIRKEPRDKNPWEGFGKKAEPYIWKKEPRKPGDPPEPVPQWQDPPPDPFNGLPDLSPIDIDDPDFNPNVVYDASHDMFDLAEDDETPGKTHAETAAEYAKRNNVALNAVIAKLQAWNPTRSFAADTMLDEATLDVLDMEFQGATTEGNKVPWPQSPHPQPPFSPSRPVISDIVIDGGPRRPRRDVRFD